MGDREFPTDCPVCERPLIRPEDAARHRCPYPDCPAQVRGRIEHFSQRNAMDIEHFDERTIDLLVTAWHKTMLAADTLDNEFVLLRIKDNRVGQTSEKCHEFNESVCIFAVWIVVEQNANSFICRANVVRMRTAI